MAKLTDLGRKESFDASVAMESRRRKNQIDYPHLSLRDPIPENLLSKEIESEVRLEIVAKVIEKGIDETSKRKDKNLRTKPAT